MLLLFSFPNEEAPWLRKAGQLVWAHTASKGRPEVWTSLAVQAAPKPHSPVCHVIFEGAKKMQIPLCV